MFSLKLNHSGWCSQWHHVLSGSLSQIQLLSLKIYRTIHVCLYCISTWCFLTTSVVEAETMRDNENTRGASFLLCSDIYDECADYFAGMAHTEDDLCLRRENYQPQCPHREGPRRVHAPTQMVAAVLSCLCLLCGNFAVLMLLNKNP